MQVIALQWNIAWEDKVANHQRIRELAASAAIQPGALVVLPEMCATGFSMHVDTIAESKDGPTQSFLCELAREHGCFVMGGVVTRGSNSRGRNEAVIFGPEGQEVSRYCKLHPFSYAGETKYYEPGEGIDVFPWHELAVSPFVCYDLRFPEAFRQAVRSGAQLLVVIANWPQVREAHWQGLLRARAIENQAYVVGVNRTGSDPHVHYGGRSVILGPRGETLAEAGAEEGVISSELEVGPLLDYRQQFPALADIRPDLFAK